MKIAFFFQRLMWIDLLRNKLKNNFFFISFPNTGNSYTAFVFLHYSPHNLSFIFYFLEL